jgi:uncharacterized protein (DUF427 family)
MSGDSTGTAPNGKPFESVWDFPRPPRVERVDWRIRVVHAGAVIVDAPCAIRVLETSQAPAYYVAFEHVADEHLRASPHRTYCEWKGMASYADVVVEVAAGGAVARQAAWSYPEPTAGFEALAGHWAFYAQALDDCWVDDERVLPNDGNFYGGWVTANVTGPIKGAPGTLMW